MRTPMDVAVIAVHSSSVRGVVQNRNLAALREIGDHALAGLIARGVVVGADEGVNLAQVGNLGVEVDDDDAGLDHRLHGGDGSVRINGIVEDHVAALCDEVLDHVHLVGRVGLALAVDHGCVAMLIDNGHEAVVHGIEEFTGDPLREAEGVGLFLCDGAYAEEREHQAENQCERDDLFHEFTNLSCLLLCRSYAPTDSPFVTAF